MAFLLRNISYSADGRQIVRSSRINDDLIKIGRDPDSDIRLNDLAVALHHATLEQVSSHRLGVSAEAGLTIEIDGNVTQFGQIDTTTGGTIKIGPFRLRVLPQEMGSDDISLGGTTVDATGGTGKITQFTVGDFDDGDVKDYSPPKQFAQFEITKGIDWPKSYFVTFVLAEVDMGGLASFLDQLLGKIKLQVTAALTAAAGGAIGVSGGIVGAAIGVAVGYVVGKIFEWLSAWWSDDIFQPVTGSIELASQNARWTGNTISPLYAATFSGHDGRYELTYDWRLTA